VASKTTPAWENNPGKSHALMVVGVVVFSAVLGGLYMGMQSYAAGVYGNAASTDEFCRPTQSKVAWTRASFAENVVTCRSTA
jgi:hypothetical protein